MANVSHLHKIYKLIEKKKSAECVSFFFFLFLMLIQVCQIKLFQFQNFIFNAKASLSPRTVSLPVCGCHPSPHWFLLMTSQIFNLTGGGVFQSVRTPPPRSRSPAFSSTIWSFWQRSMKPSMRLANSTTYWMASVIFTAQSCHMASRGCRHNKSHSRDSRQLPGIHSSDWSLLFQWILIRRPVLRSPSLRSLSQRSLS